MGATRVKPTNPKLRRGRETSQIYTAWPLGHRSTPTPDHGGGKNSLSFVGSAAWTTGPDGPAVSFPGGTGNYLQSASNVFDPSTTDFTAALWFLIAATGAQSLLASTGKSWLDINASTQLRSLIATTTLSSGASGVPTTNTWHHAALTFTAGTLTIYLDGQSVASAARTIASSTGQLNVGANNTGANNLNGQVGMAGVSLWTRALTQTEILRLVAQPYRMWTPRRRYAMTSVQPVATGTKVRRTLYLRSGSRGVA